MTLRKWKSSSQEMLYTIPKETEKVQQLSSSVDHHKALGMADMKHVSTPSSTQLSPLTKRMIASEVAKTFDLLGWYSL